MLTFAIARQKQSSIFGKRRLLAGPAGPHSQSLTVVPVLGPTASRRREQDPARTVRGGVEQSGHIAVQGRHGPPVADDMGEGARGAEPGHHPSLPAVGGPPVQDRRAYHCRAGGEDAIARRGEGRG